MNGLNFRIVVVLLLCVLISTKALGQFRGENKPAKVITQELQFQAEQVSVEAVGTAEAFRSVNIFAASADKVTQVNFVPGQQVQKGHLLLALDARRQQAALSRAKIQLEDAKRTLKRLEQSKMKGASTQSALDAAETAKALAEVALIDAQTDLEDRFVIAPFSGVVGLTDIEVGDRITQQTQITTLDDRQKLYINFRAPESSLSVLLEDSTMLVEPWTDRTKSLEAVVEQVDSRISEEDRTIRVRAVLDNQNDLYRPGMSFRVNVSLLGQEYAVIPESGLSWGATGAFVWIVKDDKAFKVSVQIKQRLRGKVLVSGELLKGSRLIVEGIQRLRSGQEVEEHVERAG